MVEIMRKERNVPFDVPADFTGPYPSADTCIMLDVAARLGRSCCMLGVTGDDTFADVVTNRLSRDGVDISHMTRLAGKGTIIVFVRYEADGTREYLECQNNAAATEFCAENIDSAVVSQARWVHFSGEVLCICADPQRREAMLKVLRSVSPDAKVSLDPNFVESDIADLQALVQPFIDRADLILPSEGEARQMMGTQTDEQACEMLAAKGKIVALKRGSRGDGVYAVTSRLAELGYPISATNYYNDSVVSAVRLFQSANGLSVDGMAGKLTQKELYSVSAIGYQESGETYPTLVRGDRGMALIYTLQQRLKDLGYYTIRVDGIFGSGTQRAVRWFQSVNGLAVTGKADSATQQLLYSSQAKAASGYSPDSYDTLSRSNRYNANVVPLQRRLKALGYLSGSADGYFGSNTYRAVRSFQSRNGLAVTGVADPGTQQLLYSSSARPASGSSSSSSSSTGYRLLYWGCKGDAVKRLQQALIDAGYKSYVRTADGIYGKWTYDAVRAYQKDVGLSVDGIAGKNTQNKLYGTNY